jgi:hypothetical protein
MAISLDNQIGRESNMKFQPSEKGVVAILTLVSCTVLLMRGIDTVVAYALLSVVFGYFGIEIWPYPQIKRRKREE